MRAGVARAMLGLLSLGAVACDRKPTPTSSAPSSERPKASASASAAASARPDAGADWRPWLHAEPDRAPRTAGPAAPGASKEARTDAVLAVLAGGEPARSLPLRDTEPDLAFDTFLRFGMRHASRHKPSVTLKPLSTYGKLPKAEVTRALQAELPRVGSCYASGLGRNPSLEGRVAVVLVVDASGKAIQHRNGGSNVPDSAVVSCVVERLAQRVWPAPTEGKLYRVVARFDLKPG